MKILVVADEESKILYDYYKPGMLDDIDLQLHYFFLYLDLIFLLYFEVQF